ncbi:MAG: HAD family hydrolase [Anaerolineae bacterium]
MGVLPKAVFFDFGGVLLRSEDESSRRAWAERLGMDPAEMTALLYNSELMQQGMLGHIGVDEMWQGLGAELGLDAKEALALQADFFRGDRLNEELLDFARRLRPHYRLAILSNAWNNAREIFTETLGLDEIFETMIISAEVGLMKPDPRIYHLALKRMGVAPPEAVFLDDLPENVEAARDVGLRAVLYRNNPQAIAEVQAQLGLASDL